MLKSRALGNIQCKETPETSLYEPGNLCRVQMLYPNYKIINTTRELISFGAVFTQQNHSINHLSLTITDPLVERKKKTLIKERKWGKTE